MRTMFKIITWVGIAALVVGFVVLGIYIFGTVTEGTTGESGNWYHFALIMGGGFLLSAGLIGGKIGNPFVKKRLLREGKPALGTLVDVSETGLYMGEANHPQMEMTLSYTTATGAECTGTYRRFFSFAEIGQLQIGEVLPIRYDEAKPGEVAVDWDMDAQTIQALAIEEQLREGTLDRESLQIVEKGVKATGLILESAPTGNIGKDQTEHTFRVKITSPSGETLEAQTTRFIFNESLPTLQAGCTTELYYMPDEPSKMVFTA